MVNAPLPKAAADVAPRDRGGEIGARGKRPRRRAWRGVPDRTVRSLKF